MPWRSAAPEVATRHAGRGQAAEHGRAGPARARDARRRRPACRRPRGRRPRGRSEARRPAPGAAGCAAGGGGQARPRARSRPARDRTWPARSPSSAHRSVGDQVGGPRCGTGRTTGSGRRRRARPPGRPAPAGARSPHAHPAPSMLAGSAMAVGRAPPVMPSPGRAARPGRRQVTMQVSATLKIGQCGSSRKSTTWPRAKPGLRRQPVGEVAAGPAQEQAQGHGPGPAAQPAGDPDQDDHHAGAMTVSTQVMPVAVENAAPGLRVRSKPQHRSEHPTGLVRGEMGDGQGLGDLIDTASTLSATPASSRTGVRRWRRTG